MKKLVFFDTIDWKNSPKVRAGLQADVVDDYAERYRKREDMPMPLVADMGALGLWCLDGMHRIHGAKKNGSKALQCEVRSYTPDEALKEALISNEGHGLRRSNEDKRRCVSTALLAWPEKSNLAISQLTRVDDKTVAAVRKELEKAGEVDKNVVRKTTDGRAVRKSGPKPTKRDDLTDATGYIIPNEIRGAWEEADGLALELTNHVGVTKNCLTNAQKSKDLLFVEVNFSAAISDLEKVYQAVQAIEPHAVCPVCNGHPEIQEKGCAMCKGRGFISKFRWTTVVPDELKKVRAKFVRQENN